MTVIGRREEHKIYLQRELSVCLMCRAKRNIHILSTFNNARTSTHRFRGPALKYQSVKRVFFSKIEYSRRKVIFIKHRAAGTMKTGNLASDLVLNESSSQAEFLQG